MDPQEARLFFSWANFSGFFNLRDKESSIPYTWLIQKSYMFCVVSSPRAGVADTLTCTVYQGSLYLSILAAVVHRSAPPCGAPFTWCTPRSASNVPQMYHSLFSLRTYCSIPYTGDICSYLVTFDVAYILINLHLLHK